MNRITINGQQFVETTENLPVSNGVFYQNKWYEPLDNFKAGDWIMENWESSPFYNRTPFKIIEVKDTFICYERENELGKYSFCSIDSIRKATHSEILRHLERLADQKGFGKGTKIKSMISNDIVTIYNDHKKYIMKYDQFYIGDILVYQDGKWAEKVEESKDYEILSFKKDDFIYYKNSNNKFEQNEIGIQWELFTLLHNPYYEIHSIKDLKTGHIYTIGDKVLYQNDHYIINKFDLIDHKIQMKLSEIDSLVSFQEVKPLSI